jgi:hypothetical protein
MPTATTAPEPVASVLPGSRVVSFYGHPNSAQMGILGEFDLETVAAQLWEQAAAYAAADLSHPVVPALELIATVAQPLPGDDGTYLSYTGDEIIGQYSDYAAANGMLLILDLQIGHSTIRELIGAENASRLARCKSRRRGAARATRWGVAAAQKRAAHVSKSQLSRGFLYHGMRPSAPRQLRGCSQGLAAGKGYRGAANDRRRLQH